MSLKFDVTDGLYLTSSEALRMIKNKAGKRPKVAKDGMEHRADGL